MYLHTPPLCTSLAPPPHCPPRHCAYLHMSHVHAQAFPHSPDTLCEHQCPTSTHPHHKCPHLNACAPLTHMHTLHTYIHTLRTCICHTHIMHTHHIYTCPTWTPTSCISPSVPYACKLPPCAHSPNLLHLAPTPQLSSCPHVSALHMGTQTCGTHTPLANPRPHIPLPCIPTVLYTPHAH